jgi:hypothetical protein
MQRVKFASWIPAHAGALTFAVVTAVVFAGAHCSNNVDHPPALGNCVPTKGVPCGSGATPGGGGGGPGMARDSGLDASASPDGEAGVMCGMTAMLLNAQSVTCVPCIVGTLVDANANCCAEDNACAFDTNCLRLVQCSLACLGNSACIGQCQSLAPQDTNFTAFSGCVQTTCPQCPALSGGTPVVRDM